MADSTKFVATRETYRGRWEIIYEVRLPTVAVTRRDKNGKTVVENLCTFVRHKKDGSDETVNVAPHIVKAVLLGLAQYDFPGSEVYKGVRNIVHATDVPKPSVDKAIRVLRDAGLLKRTPRGWHETSLSVLDWDALEKLRVPFRSTFSASAPKGPLPDLTEDEQEVLNDLGPAAKPVAAVRPTPAPEVEPSTALMTQIRALPHIGEKLPNTDGRWVAARLTEALGEDGATQALSLLAENPAALIRAAGANKSKSGYLRTCAIKAFRDDAVSQAMDVADEIRAGEVNCSRPEGSEAYARAIHGALLSSPFAQEFEVHEVAQGDAGWWVPLSPLAADKTTEPDRNDYSEPEPDLSEEPNVEADLDAKYAEYRR